VLLIPVANLPPVSLILVVHLDLRISLRILEKIWNGPNGILWGWGKTDSGKNPEAKYLVTLSLFWIETSGQTGRIQGPEGEDRQSKNHGQRVNMSMTATISDRDTSMSYTLQRIN
jgi:hypothetical protein